jgi:hypothetical protein
MEWKHITPQQNEFQDLQSVGKVLLPAFRDAWVIIFLEFLDHDAIINADCYCTVLRYLKRKWFSKAMPSCLCHCVTP